MTEVIAGIMIFATCCMIGWAIERTYAARVNFLNEFVDFINFSSTEIGFFKSEVGEIKEKFSCGKGTDFSRYIRGDSKKILIKKTDSEMVDEYISGLGKADFESVKKFQALYSERAEKALKNAEEERGVKGKMTKKIFPLLGLAFFILLI